MSRYLLDIDERERDQIINALNHLQHPPNRLIESIKDASASRGIILEGPADALERITVTSSQEGAAYPVYYSYDDKRSEMPVTVNPERVELIAWLVQRDLVLISVARALRKAADDVELLSHDTSDTDDAILILEAAAESCSHGARALENASSNKTPGRSTQGQQDSRFVAISDKRHKAKTRS